MSTPQALYHTRDLCPACGGALYAFGPHLGDGDGRVCGMQCGYARPAPQGGAARLLIIGTDTERDTRELMRVRRMVANLPLAQLMGWAMDWRLVLEWGAALGVNVGGYSNPINTAREATHVLLLPRATIPEAMRPVLAEAGAAVRGMRSAA